MLEDVSLSIAGGQSLQATFSFQSIAFENPGAVKAPASTKALTPDEKARALAAFLARVSSQAAKQK